MFLLATGCRGGRVALAGVAAERVVVSIRMNPLRLHDVRLGEKTYVLAMTTPKRMNPTQLRRNLYRVLDEILRTGQPVEIERNGRTLRIEVVGGEDRLANLRDHPEAVCGDPDDLDTIGWADAWRP